MNEPVRFTIELPPEIAYLLSMRSVDTGEDFGSIAAKAIAYYLEPQECRHLPSLEGKLNLEAHQLLEVERMRRSLPNISESQAKDLLINAMQTIMVKDNVLRGFLKP